MGEPIIIKFSEQIQVGEMSNRDLMFKESVAARNAKPLRKSLDSQKGLGKFNMLIEVYKSPFSMDKELCQNVQNMGFYETKCSSKREIQGIKDERQMQSRHADKDEFQYSKIRTKSESIGCIWRRKWCHFDQFHSSTSPISIKPSKLLNIIDLYAIFEQLKQKISILQWSKHQTESQFQGYKPQAMAYYSHKLLNKFSITELQGLEQSLKLLLINQNRHQANIIITMIRIPTLFSQLLVRLRDATVCAEIFEEQMKKFDLATYKIRNISPQTMVKLYENLWKKYNLTGELSVTQNSWHQNQRRVFVWFIIHYTYFLQRQENYSLLKLSQDQQFWNEISSAFFNKNPELLQFQYLNMLKIKRRENWTQEEDRCLLDALEKEEEGRWNQISKRMFFDSNRVCFRTPKQCRERWLNHLDQNKKRGAWTPAEDHLIFTFILQQGKHWSRIVPLLNHTRTQHMIKNRYNSILSKILKGNKTNENEAIRVVLAKLKKQISNEGEASSSQEKLTHKKSETQVTVEEDDLNNNDEKECSEILTPQPIHQETRLFNSSQAVYYTYFMDFNSNIYISPAFTSQLSSNNQTYLASMDSFGFKPSVNSSFTVYNAGGMV